MIFSYAIFVNFQPDKQEPLDHPAVPATVTGHPRLFFTADEIPALKTRAATTHREIWLPIEEYVASQLGTTPPSVAPPEGDLQTYRNYGNQLIPFALACIVTEEADYCALAKTHLLAYARWTQWGENSYRDLGHAHMLVGNAIAYDWLYSRLTPAERQLVQTSLISWTEKMYEASTTDKVADWNNWWRKSYAQNHYSTNHSALGLASLALLGETDQAPVWLDQAVRQMVRVQYLLNEIGDGSWHEGLDYQGYALTLSLPFLINLRRIQGEDLIPHTYLSHYPYWRLYNHLPNTSQFIMAHGNSEWSRGGYRPQNVLRFAADEYKNGHAEWMAQQLIAADGRHTSVWATPWYVFEFFYYNPTISAQPPTDLPKARTFPDFEGVIWRTGWDHDDLVFGLKTGAYGGRFIFNSFRQGVYPWDTPCEETGCKLNFRHGHDDTNTFYLYRAGQWLAPETMGVGLNDSAYHNTLLIDGEGQYRPANDDQGEIEAFINSDGFLETVANTPHFDYAAADATRRYKNIKGIRDVTRHVLFVRPDYLLMLDNLVADRPHQYTWVSHFDEGVSVEGRWIQGQADHDQLLGINVVAPQQFETSTGDDNEPYIHVYPNTPVDDVRLINLLYPTDRTHWQDKPGVALQADNGQATLVQVQKTNETDEIILTYTQPGSIMTIGSYESDGQVALVTRDDKNHLKKLFSSGATFLTDQSINRMLVSNLSRHDPFEAIYSGQTVMVSGSISTEVTLYAPGITQLIVNGVPWTFGRSGDYISFEVKDTYRPPPLGEELR